ncbi:MAG: glycosyltransferase family 39 protein [Elusimicrobia bacterium]|nr:glycosyltransferase family 39 protein [Elusimicrobiota bacterium]
MCAKLLLAIVLSSPFWNLGHPLWEVDDARYAEVPREMIERGDWLTPSLNYFDYVEKPPLIYWLPALSYKIFGVSEAAARLPNALLTLLGMLGVWWLGSWLFCAQTGLWAALILGTCAQYFVLGHFLTPDTAVSVFLLWATAAILRCLRKPEDTRWAGPLAWFAMALGFLSKGLISLLLPCLWTVLLLGFFPELRRGAKGLLFNWGVLIFVLIIGSWVLAMESRHPGFCRFYFIREQFQRYLTPRYARPGPWYYFFGVDAGGLLPWTPLAWAATMLPLLRWRREDPGRRQLALWVAATFAFFSASSSKLPTYIMPIFTHQALLAAELLGRLDGKAARWVRRGAFLLAGISLGAALTACVLAQRAAWLPLPQTAIWAASAFALAQAFALGTLALGRGGPLRPAAWASAANASLLLAAHLGVSVLSAKALSLEISARFSPGDRIIAYDKYLHGVAFYVRRPVDVVNWLGELSYAKQRGADPSRFGDDDTIRRLKTGPGSPRTFVTLENKLLRHFRTLRPKKDFRRVSSFGNWILVEL